MRQPFPKSGRPRRIAAAIVVTLVAFAALWSVPRVSSAAASWLTAPTVRSKTVTPERPLVVTRDTRSAPSAAEDPGATELLSASQSEAGPASAGPPEGAAVSQIDARMRFEMVGLICDDADGVDSLTVYVRAGPDGRSWGEWLEAPVERVAEEGDEANASVFTDPIWVGGARHLQVAVTSADGSCRTVPAPRLVFLNTSGDATLADRFTTTARTVACTLGGLRVASDVSAMTTKPTIVLRSRVGSGRVLAYGQPQFRPAQDGLRAPHGRQQLLHGRRRRRDRARHLLLPHADAGLERHRLQLPHRPLRRHLRRPLRRHHATRRSGPTCWVSTRRAPASR